jgi:hypothetical protein
MKAKMGLHVEVDFRIAVARAGEQSNFYLNEEADP